MSAAATTSSPSAIDPHRFLGEPNPTATHMSTTPVDSSRLSPFSIYHGYSASSSPSSFTAEISDFSEYADFNGADDFFGVNFDGEEQDANPATLGDIPLPTTELPVDAYTRQTSDYSTHPSSIPLDSTHTPDANRTAPAINQLPKIIPPTLSTYKSPAQYESSSEPSSSSSLPTMSLEIPPNIVTSQPNSDINGSSQTGGEGFGFGNAMNHNTSPRVILTSWGSLEERELPAESEFDKMDVEATIPHQGLNFGIDEECTPKMTSAVPQHVTSYQNNDWDAESHENRTGVPPSRRKSLSDAPILSLKDLEKIELAEEKRRDVEEWRSQTGESSEADDEPQPPQSSSNLAAPLSGNRRRAKSAGDVDTHDPRKPFGIIEFRATPTHSKDPEEGQGIEPASDTVSIHENRLVEGQLYLNSNVTEINEEDFKLMSISRHWHDAPLFPLIIKPSSQENRGITAAEAMANYQKMTDETFSILSRTATWGTRRRSEPSLADVESIRSGGLLKRMSFGKSKDKKPGVFGHFGSQIKSTLARKTSDSGNKLKRTNSDRDGRGRPEAPPRKDSHTNLAPPRSPSSNRRRPSSPRLNTNVGLSPNTIPGQVRRDSFSTSPKNPLGFVRKQITRMRSGSDVNEESRLAGLWRDQGGPPVPALAAHPLDTEDIKPLDDHRFHDQGDVTGDDEDDDEAGDEGDETMDFDPSITIIPNIAGFQEHLLRLNPKMESLYLRERIAHQQSVRFKGLLQIRVKHSGALLRGSCDAGAHCMEAGGAATHFDARGKSRNDALNVVGDLSDGDSNPEGQLTSDSFPPGVPMPPTTSLPAEFECQLCYRVKKFQKPSDWTKHVHEDVQPFTCTYANCRDPKPFKRKADWVRHENERHRHLEWWTCEVDDCTHKCYRKDNFLQHLVREHKMTEPKLKNKAAVKKAVGAEEVVWNMVRSCRHEATSRPEDEPCKFCGKVYTSWKKLTVHLGKHMEHISLPILTLVDQQQVDANTIISPVEALPTRQGPLTPVGSAMHYNNNNGISPNVPSMGQFASPMYSSSPNVGAMPHYIDPLYNQSMAYGQTTASTMENQYHLHNEPDLLFDPASANNMTGYHHFDSSGQQSAIYTPMDQSPLMEQPRTFTTVNPPNSHNRSYPGALTPQGYNSYPTSTHTLSPDPPSLPYQGPNQPLYHTNSLTPEPVSYSQLSPHPQSLSYPQPSITMLGVTDQWASLGTESATAPIDLPVGRNRGSSLGNNARFSSSPRMGAGAAPFSSSPQRLGNGNVNMNVYSTSPQGMANANLFSATSNGMGNANIYSTSPQGLGNGFSVMRGTNQGNGNGFGY